MVRDLDQEYKHSQTACQVDRFSDRTDGMGQQIPTGSCDAFGCFLLSDPITFGAGSQPKHVLKSGVKHLTHIFSQVSNQKDSRRAATKASVCQVRRLKAMFDSYRWPVSTAIVVVL